MPDAPPDPELQVVLASLAPEQRAVVERHLAPAQPRRGGQPQWKTERRRLRDQAIQAGAQEFLAGGLTLTETADQIMVALRRRRRAAWCRDALESGAPIPKPKQIKRIILKNNN